MKFRAAVLILILLSCNSESENCSNFKNGTFIYPNITGTEVNRNGGVQTETNALKGYVETYSVTWTGPCEYYLLLKETTDSSNIIGPYDTLFIEIVERTDTSYRYRSKALGMEFDGEMIKISE